MYQVTSLDHFADPEHKISTQCILKLGGLTFDILPGASWIRVIPTWSLFSHLTEARCIYW